MKKRAMGFVLALAMCLSLSIPVCAYENTETPVVEALGEDTYFLPVTREEYIAAKAEGLGISYEEAAAEVDAKITAAIAAIPSETLWTETGGFNNGDTTTTSYGWVYKIYTHASGAQVWYGVEAVRLRSRQGSNWVEISESTASCRSEGGIFTVDGVVHADIVTPTQLFVDMAVGIYISVDVALQLDLNTKYLKSSGSLGTTIYFAQDVFDSFTQVVPH